MLKVLKLPQLRKKIGFTLFIIIVFRLLAHVPVPGVDTSVIKEFIGSNALLGIFDIFSGGAFRNFSIVTLGLGPYINASIIMQLFTVMIPSLEELSKEGESGREKINQYTRILTIPISIIQAYGVYFLLSSQTTQSGQSVIESLSAFDLAAMVLTLSAGGMFLVWLGDLVTENGIGNGISILIFTGIISRLPLAAVSFVTNIALPDPLSAVGFVVLTILVIVGVVLVNEGTRNVLIQYGRRGTSSQKITNYLPIKINQAGVIPIIFAVSVVLLPSVVASPLASSSTPALYRVGIFLSQNFNQNSSGYNVFYFILVVAFTFFYTFVQFNPEKIADDVKKRGGFIPGIRPGKATKRYLQNIVIKLTMFGASFLGLIAILPYFMQIIFGLGNVAVGGTSLLIAVSVVLETIRQAESQAVTKSYEGYLD